MTRLAPIRYLFSAYLLFAGSYISAASESLPELLVCDANGSLDTKAFQQLRNIGVEAVNFDIKWSEAEFLPTDFDWASIDRYVEQAEAAGMPLYVGIASHYAPEWMDGKKLGFVNQGGRSSPEGSASRRYPSHWNPEAHEAFLRLIDEDRKTLRRALLRCVRKLRQAG